jgi:D-alanyl-D-alanine carboxypeptidase (penicillin-binding protein 5/6)
VLSAGLGALHAGLIPRFFGLDEFSYYATVKYYAAHHAMPVLGRPGVSYEAQMGPGFYVPAAIVYKLLHPAGESAAFYAVRALNVALLPLLTLLAFALARELRPGDELLALLAAVLVGLNPHLLTLGGLIYNDMLSIVLGMSAVWLFVRWWRRDRLDVWRGLLVGLVIALAVITKPGTVFLAAALPLALLIRRRRAALPAAAAMVLGVALGCGWWFIRNVHLYGELGTRTGLARVHFPLTRGVLNANEVYSFLISSWGPSDTLNPAYHLSGVVKLVAVLVTVAALAGWLVGRREVLARVVPGTALTYVLALVLAIVVFLYTHLRIISVSPRVVFAAFFVVALVLGLGLTAAVDAVARSGRLRAGALAAVMSLLVLASVVDVRTIHDAGPKRPVRTQLPSARGAASQHEPPRPDAAAHHPGQLDGVGHGEPGGAAGVDPA